MYTDDCKHTQKLIWENWSFHLHVPAETREVFVAHRGGGTHAQTRVVPHARLEQAVGRGVEPSGTSRKLGTVQYGAQDER